MSKTTSVIICGPSGVGKGTIIKSILQRYKGKVALSVSHTTRKPRAGEINGIHYHFVAKEAMQLGISQNLFLEHATVHGNMYGTSKQAVETIIKSGRVCLLDLDVNGVKQMKIIEYPAKFIFIAPPSIDILESRLRNRATETEENILLRLKNAAAEIEYGVGENNFDVVITNNDLEESVTCITNKINEWCGFILQQQAQL